MATRKTEAERPERQAKPVAHPVDAKVATRGVLDRYPTVMARLAE